MKPTSFIMWRKRFKDAKQNMRNCDFKEGRFKCSRQRQINNNKISKKINQKLFKLKNIVIIGGSKGIGMPF
jgi:hypothetical protein